MKRILLACALLFVMQAPSFAAVPNPTENPVFASLQKSGAKLYYLGKNSGLDGWFIIKDGQVQILYSTPDNKAVLVGGLLGANGENITVTQVTELAARNKDVGDLINSLQKGQGIPGAQAEGSVPVQMTATATPPAAKEEPGAPAASPGERLIHDLTGASGATLGTNASAPEILMVMDVDCPHCQATWKLLRDLVMKGDLRLHMIPIGNVDSNDERAGAVLIGLPDAMTAWDKYVAGDKSRLAGTPPMAALVGIRANHMLTDSWKIDKTPYLVYRAKDGKVKIVEGQPSTLPAVLGDLGL